MLHIYDQNMFIVHIAGSPGSGKTYLLNKIKKLKVSNLIVKDLDEFTTPIFESKEWKELKTNKEKGVYYKQEAKIAINKFIRSHQGKNFIFGGLGVCFPSMSLDKGSGAAYPIIIVPPKGYRLIKLFLDAPIDIILKQRLKRDILDKLNKNIRNLDFSSEWIIQYNKYETAYFRHKKYKFGKESEIYRYVVKLLHSE